MVREQQKRGDPNPSLPSSEETAALIESSRALRTSTQSFRQETRELLAGRRSITPEDSRLTHPGIDAGTIMHVASKAKLMGVMSGYERRALYSLGQYLYRRGKLTPKQVHFLGSLLARAKRLGVDKWFCGEEDCIHCVEFAEHCQNIDAAGESNTVSGSAADASNIVEERKVRPPILSDELKASGGWTVDVLFCVRLLKQRRFRLEDIYRFEEKLSRLHPDNRHVRAKIRQQLQALRDLGYIEFLGDGNYLLRA